MQKDHAEEISWIPRYEDLVSREIQWSFTLEEEAFSSYKLHKYEVFWRLTWLHPQERVENSLKRKEKKKERERGGYVRPTARSDLDF